MKHASEKAETDFHSNVVSVFQAGATVGALGSVYFANTLGRRTCLLFNLIIYILGAALMTGANGVGLVYAGRILTGWGVGASTMLVPVYVAECSPPHIRGRLVGLYEVGVQLGTMVRSGSVYPSQEVLTLLQIGFWIPYGLLRTVKGTPQWRIPFALQLIPAGVSGPL